MRENEMDDIEKVIEYARYQNHTSSERAKAQYSQLLNLLKELYEPAKIAVNQIICIGSEEACQPCENREKLAIALDNVEKFLEK